MVSLSMIHYFYVFSFFLEVLAVFLFAWVSIFVTVALNSFSGKILTSVKLGFLFLFFAVFLFLGLCLVLSFKTCSCLLILLHFLCLSL